MLSRGLDTPNMLRNYPEVEVFALLAVTVMAALMAAPAAFADDNAPTFDFHGYMRAGVGHFSHGGSQTRWNSDYVGRLGNEEDTYGELALGSRVFKKGDTEFYVNSRVAVKSMGDNDYEATDRANGVFSNADINDNTTNAGSYSWEDTEFALRELNAMVKGFIPGKKDATLWAGKRFYQRHDVHLWDYYYEDLSGSGAGLENLQIGPGNFSVAWVRKAHDSITKMEDGTAGSYWDTKTLTDENGKPILDDDGNPQTVLTKRDSTYGNINIFDIRYGASLWNGGWLEISYSAMDPDKAHSDHVSYNDNAASAGWSSMWTVEATWSGSWGFNKAAFQYGNHGWNIGNHNTWYGSYADMSDNKWWRVIDQGEVTVLDPRFHIMYAARYDRQDFGYDRGWGTGDGFKTFAVAVRPSYQVTDYSRIMAELGAYWTKYTGIDNADDQGQKYTLAYALSPSASLWARPEIRLYVSYLHHSNGDSIPDTLHDNLSWSSAVNFGIQAEAWW